MYGICDTYKDFDVYMEVFREFRNSGTFGNSQILHDKEHPVVAARLDPFNEYRQFFIFFYKQTCTIPADEMYWTSNITFKALDYMTNVHYSLPDKISVWFYS